MIDEPTATDHGGTAQPTADPAALTPAQRIARALGTTEQTPAEPRPNSGRAD